MKIAATLLLLALSTLPAAAGNWFGSGPWANATYYPGNLDGKYQAAVAGVNTSGVLGFAIRDGSPPFLEREVTQAFPVGTTLRTIANQEIEIDRSLNYYAIFVKGRTYVGTTAAGINYDNSSVNGTLIGTQPTTITTTNSQVVSQLVTNAVPIIITNTTNDITTQFITNSVPIIITNTTNEVVSQTLTNVVTTNETVIITNNGVVVETNVFYDLTNTETVFFTNTIQVPEVIGTNEIVETVFFTNTIQVPEVIGTNEIVETIFSTNDLINPVVIVTGVDGFFNAGITGKQGIFTFNGPGQLISPGTVIDNQQVNPETAFNVNGIRVSFSSQANFQRLSGSGQ